MDLHTALRLLLVFLHLLLCALALHTVLSTDWRLLRSRINAQQLDRAHHRVLWTLLGLWATGAALVGMDTGFVATEVLARPKLVAKLVCVSVLTLNGLLLRGWCFPRLAGDHRLSRSESMVLMACGALSSTSWLMAAFYGTARPLQSWPLADCLALYAVALAAALPVALSLEGRLRQGREARAQRRARGLRPTAPAELDATPAPPATVRTA